MRKILIIGSALAAALFLGSGVFASEQRVLERLHSMEYVQYIHVEQADMTVSEVRTENAEMVAAASAEYDALERTRLCSQERTEPLIAANRVETVLMNRANLVYVDPLIDPGRSQANHQSLV